MSVETTPIAVRWIKHVSDRIRELRIRAKLTQDAVADRMNVDRATYKRWETGTNNMKLDTLVDVATALDVNPRDLFDPLEGAAMERARGRPKRST